MQKNKIQTRQNTKEQNTNGQNTYITKYKCKKIKIGQNTNKTKCKILKYKHDKIQIHGVPIENQCVKGGGLLYGGCIDKPKVVCRSQSQKLTTWFARCPRPEDFQMMILPASKYAVSPSFLVHSRPPPLTR